ncbi:MAG: heme A synthase [candidate division KSB1 bacterium]|nr:heme A synthase [candidate division KSB1 bacterium]MDZ7301553.1 heme A synthase [candidate division KSB1 bacterium]MDZ7311031.1 heme A synthase [candidate division KSB1 bacterium]
MSNVSLNTNIWLHRFTKLLVGATFILIFIGGLVTSTESGLAVPDWPTTHGYSMFSFPLSKMIGGILYEHGHRLVATAVGLLMMILAFWMWQQEPRKWVRQLSLIALLAVIAQGILGGVTVLLKLPPAVSVSHATLAQTFFCLTIGLAMFTSPKWQQQPPQIEDTHRPSLRNLSVATVASVYVQLILGAVMRHTKSGLAIPDFPLAFGRLIPPFTSDKVAIHFTHRVGALVVTILVAWTVLRVLRNYRQERQLYRPALLLACTMVLQITLGALTVWTQKAVIPTTAHVATGALILGTSLVLALQAYRLRAVPERVHAKGRTVEAIQATK